MSPTPWDLPPRIAAKIAVDADTGCWLWTAARTPDYGAIHHEGRQYRAHRFIYELIAYGIPEGMQMDHLCRVKRCVSPLHVEPVTPSENQIRSGLAIRSTPYYPCGHPRTAENSRRGATLYARCCRTCHEAIWRAGRARRKQATQAA